VHERPGRWNVNAVVKANQRKPSREAGSDASQARQGVVGAVLDEEAAGRSREKRRA